MAWRDRVARFLTWRRVRVYASVLVLLYLVAWIDVLVLGSPPLNSAGTPMSGDYIAFHAAGRLVLTGQAANLYDHATVSSVQEAMLGHAIPNFYDAYRNPPFFALLFAPLALLDLLPGFAAWMMVSLACLALSLSLLAAEIPWLRQHWRGTLMVVFAFPPVYFGLIDGENAVLSLLLYVLMFRALKHRQDAAMGVWAALGLFKPQLFIVFPILFLATRRWRALLAYVLVALLLFGLSAWLVGLGGLEAWGRILLEPEASNSTANGWRMASLKAFLDSVFTGQNLLSVGLYLGGSCVALVALARAWLHEHADLPVLWAFTCLVTVLIDPHLVDYDLTVLVSAGIVSLSTGASPLLRWLTAAIYVSALFRAQVPIGDAAVLITPVLLVVLAVVVVARLQLLSWSPARRPQRQTALS